MHGPRTWRPVTWFAIVANLLLPLWVLHGLQVSEEVDCSSTGCAQLGQGSSPLIGMLVIWLLADLAIAATWALTLPRVHGTGPSPLS